MSVMLWGLPADSPLRRVYEQIRMLGVKVWLLDQRNVLGTQVRLSIGETVTGRVKTPEGVFHLEEVRALYIRCYDSASLPHVAASEPNSAARSHASTVDQLIAHWVEVTPAFVVSRLEAMAGNNSKPYQLNWIRQFGWKIPETLVTTDPQEARAFWEQHGTVIYKSVSSVRSRVSQLGPGHRDRFDDISSCPTQFQEFIPGTDFRAHVVGDEVFACEVRSEADDYRYAGDDEVEYLAYQFPPEIEDRCRGMSAAMGLPVSGIDLRRTPGGEWVCFEVNPSPGFSPYEESTGQPIAKSIAHLLANAEAA
jgi:glutathione synthase/RimK-type ligase-like ATP-grasp enzyme